jgi:hypothetical protein
MSVYLVCEGPADGLDVRVLDLVIAQKLKREVQIIPAGGERSLGSVASWLEERSRKPLPGGIMGSPQDRAYAVDDRDFRSLDDVEQIWQRPHQKRWVWRRHEIENYLLDPRLVADTFRALKAAHVRGADALPGDPDAVLRALQELARPMLEDHAGWLTYWHLVSHKRSAVDTRLLWPDSPLQPASDSLYPGRAEWLDYLRSECVRLKDACKQMSEDVAFDELTIVEAYDRILSQVTHPDFLASGCFLLDLGGHELLSALCAYINQAGVARLSHSDLATELLNALDRLYEPGFFEPDDFAQLAEILI